MKKRIVVLTALVVVTCSSSFASTTNDYINQRVLAAFSARFALAQTVSWNRTDTYFKATFSINGQCMFAYYNESGELIGISRNMKSNQLPINLEASLRKYMAKGWIVELFEFALESNTDYFAKIENSNEILSIRSSGTNSWVVYKRIKKG